MSWYKLLDTGYGRKLEKFGSLVLDRPAPAAIKSQPREPEAWKLADARFEKGIWKKLSGIPDKWVVEPEDLSFELRLTSQGQVGIFPEHYPSCRWLASTVEKAGRPVSILNVFGYTGAATLFTARRGAVVTHVDAAKSAIEWAKENAVLSGLGGAAIRWLVDDAISFMERETRRGNTYDIIVLDPPAFGKTKQGKQWKLTKDISLLLSLCIPLLSEQKLALLLSWHDPDIAGQDILSSLSDAGIFSGGAFSLKSLDLKAESGNVLPAGTALRWKKDD